MDEHIYTYVLYEYLSSLKHCCISIDIEYVYINTNIPNIHAFKTKFTYIYTRISRVVPAPPYIHTHTHERPITPEYQPIRIEQTLPRWPTYRTAFWTGWTALCYRGTRRLTLPLNVMPPGRGTNSKRRKRPIKRLERCASVNYRF